MFLLIFATQFFVCCLSLRFKVKVRFKNAGIRNKVRYEDVVRTVVMHLFVQM